MKDFSEGAFFFSHTFNIIASALHLESKLVEKIVFIFTTVKRRFIFKSIFQ